MSTLSIVHETVDGSSSTVHQIQLPNDHQLPQKNRTMFTKSQKKELEVHFHMNNCAIPDSATREQLAVKYRKTSKQIRSLFYRIRSEHVQIQQYLDQSSGQKSNVYVEGQACNEVNKFSQSTSQSLIQSHDNDHVNSNNDLHNERPNERPNEHLNERCNKRFNEHLNERPNKRHNERCNKRISERPNERPDKHPNKRPLEHPNERSNVNPNDNFNYNLNHIPIPLPNGNFNDQHYVSGSPNPCAQCQTSYHHLPIYSPMPPSPNSYTQFMHTQWPTTHPLMKNWPETSDLYRRMDHNLNRYVTDLQ